MSALPGWLAQFDAATPRFLGGEAEFEVERNGDELGLFLPAENGAVRPAAMAAARSVLTNLDRLDEEAKAYLFALPRWPYGDDAHLWLLIVEADNVRFCYQQYSVNDEQVLGFAREGDGWRFSGEDPRFRADAVG